MKKYLIFSLAFFLTIFLRSETQYPWNANAKAIAPPNRYKFKPAQSIRIHTGLMFDNYNSGGPRLFFEYQRQLPDKLRKFYWGVGYETRTALFRPATDIYNPPELFTQNLSANFHYHQYIWKNRIMWDFGIGPSAAYAHTDTEHYLLSGLHLGGYIGFRISPTIYLETAPALFIPFASDVYVYGPKAYRTSFSGYGYYMQYSVLPLGLRFRL